MEKKVKDISVSAFLLASEKVRLVKTERKSDKIVYFYFSPKDEAEKLIGDYWSDTASVTPRKVFNALRSLKDIIFSGS